MMMTMIMRRRKMTRWTMMTMMMRTMTTLLEVASRPWPLPLLYSANWHKLTFQNNVDDDDRDAADGVHMYQRQQCYNRQCNLFSAGWQQLHWELFREGRKARGGLRQHFQGQTNPIKPGTFHSLVIPARLQFYVTWLQATWRAGSNGEAGLTGGAEGHPGWDGEGELDGIHDEHTLSNFPN